MEDNFSMDWGGGGGAVGSGSNASDGEQWGAADETSPAHLPLTSSCVAQFLTSRGPLAVRGPVAVRGPEVGDPCSNLFALPE